MTSDRVPEKDSKPHGLAAGSEWRLAIDFGTSNTAAALEEPTGRRVSLRLGTSSDAIASCVAVFQGETITGEAARRLAGIHPAGFEPTPKRRLGEDVILLDGAPHHPVDLVGAVLEHVYDCAVRYMGQTFPGQVLLTHPHVWDEYRKSLLREAAERAGIPGHSIVLVSEPIAAAWYHAGRSAVAAGAHVAVLDFGGGTCDAALLRHDQRCDASVFTVVDSVGLDALGGEDLDAVLQDWVRRQMTEAGRTQLLQELAGPNGVHARAVLREQVKEAKHALSYHQSAPISMRINGQEWVGTITRSEFDELIQHHVRRAVDMIDALLTSTSSALGGLHHLYLTGGTSLIPAIHAQLQRLIGDKVGTLDDPKQVTSLGALAVPVVPASTAEPPRPVVLPPPTPAPKSTDLHESNADKPKGRPEDRDAEVEPRRTWRVFAVLGIALALIGAAVVWWVSATDAPKTPSLPPDSGIIITDGPPIIDTPPPRFSGPLVDLFPMISSAGTCRDTTNTWEEGDPRSAAVTVIGCDFTGYGVDLILWPSTHELQRYVSSLEPPDGGWAYASMWQSSSTREPGELFARKTQTGYDVVWTVEDRLITGVMTADVSTPEEAIDLWRTREEIKMNTSMLNTPALRS